MSEYLDRIIAELKEARDDWDELFSGKFSVQEIFDLITSLVQAGEAVITEPKTGADKHQLVHDAFDYFDEKYHIIDRLDDLIPLPFFLEPFDGPFIGKLVDFLIGQAVSVLNMTIWGSDDEPGVLIDA